MEFQLDNVRYLGADLESVKMKDGEHSMLKAHFYVQGETVDIYVIDTHLNYDEVSRMIFGEQVSLRCQLVKRDSGGYKIRFVSLV